MKFSIQFFALLAELERFVAEMTQTTGLDLVIETQDEKLVSFEPKENPLAQVRQVFWGQFDNDRSLKIEKTPGYDAQCIGMRLGLFGELQNERGLTESQLWYSGQNLGIKKEAAKIQRELKKITKTGVVMYNPKTKFEGLSKTLRYMEGAAVLSRQGVILRPIAGWNEGRVPD